MASIHFFVEGTGFSLKQKKVIRKWISGSILNEEKTLGEINYIFCSDAYLLGINKSFLKHNTLTDIITFPIESADLPFFKAEKTKHDYVNGEIYISIERVKENAVTFQTKFEFELKRVLIHGVLHLCGYKDKLLGDLKLMRSKEDYYLAQFNKYL